MSAAPDLSRAATLPAAVLHACLLAGLLACLPAQSQTLADPTQPPPEARLGVAGGADAAPVRSGPQLQSVLLGNHGRQVAVIDGQPLRPGETFQGATLVKVGKDHVVLQRGRTRQVLKLYPDARAPAARTPARSPVTPDAPEH